MAEGQGAGPARCSSRPWPQLAAAKGRVLGRRWPGSWVRLPCHPLQGVLTGAPAALPRHNVLSPRMHYYYPFSERTLDKIKIYFFKLLADALREGGREGMYVPGKKKKDPSALGIAEDKIGKEAPVLQHSTHWDASSLKYFFNPNPYGFIF